LCLTYKLNTVIYKYMHKYIYDRNKICVVFHAIYSFRLHLRVKELNLFLTDKGATICLCFIHKQPNILSCSFFGSQVLCFVKKNISPGAQWVTEYFCKFQVKILTCFNVFILLAPANWVTCFCLGFKTFFL
jgi:hypothetical protein